MKKTKNVDWSTWFHKDQRWRVRAKALTFYNKS